MKKLMILLALPLLVYGCKGEDDTKITPPYAAAGEITHITEMAGQGEFSLQFDAGSTPKEAYLIFHNASATDQGAPTLYEAPYEGPLTPRELHRDSPEELLARESGLGLRDAPWATEFNSSFPKEPMTAAGLQAQLEAQPPSLALVGDTFSFMNSSTLDTIPATLRSISTDGTITVQVWVANDSWGACFKANCMDQTMTDLYAQKFLKAGVDNDIYDWDSAIYGQPWGTQSLYNNLIPASAANVIDILFFDISNDNSTTGGILGFFWAKDNFLASSMDYSNERLMFYMDSVLTAQMEGATWEITDFWPQEMVSTLAHEYQHMIHFFQKDVLRASANTYSPTWFNEMSSQMAEDFLADKLNIPGPRGVAGTDYTAGAANNYFGRLPLYNQYNDIPFTQWLLGMDSLRNYSINYAFGAHLARNFGGPALFQAMVQSADTDTSILANGINSLGYTKPDGTPVDLDYLMHAWTTSVVTSDVTTMATPYQYNVGGSFGYTQGGILYNLGSINFFNYAPQPYLYDASTISQASLLGHSNVLTHIGTGLTGAQSVQVSLPVGTSATLVLK